jgi:hypothetical protein
VERLKMKALLKLESMGEYELENGKASYKTLVDRFVGNRVLCNNIVDIDEFIYDNVEVGNLYNEESDEYVEIYQYFICRLTESEIETLRELTQNNNDVIIAYSDVLDCHVLMVDHFGTSWDYVLTSVPLVDTYEECE